MRKRLPLEGIRVLDITVVWAGPFSTMLLGDLGAEVIGVDSIQRLNVTTRGAMARPPAAMYQNNRLGGWTQYPDRTPGDRAWNRCTFFNGHGRNKRSMTVDLTRPDGVEIFKEMVKASDILVENNSPRVLDSLGLTYDVLSEVNPRFIMIRAAAFGQVGPKRHWRGYGSNMAAVLSDYWQNQYSVDDIQKRTATFSMDTVGACAIVMAAMMALRVREKTGKGQYIDLGQTQTVLACMGEAMMDYTMNGRVQQTMGNRLPAALQGCYRCTGDDDWVVITLTNDEEWAGLCRALGNPTWTKEDRFADFQNRYQNQDELDANIEVWTSQRDKYEVMHLLQQEGVPAGPVMSEKDAHEDPHVKERDFFLEITQKWSGTHRYPGFAWKFSKTPQEVRMPPPGVGEHNEYVYKQVLGKTDEEYEKLVKDLHIGDEYLPEVR